MRQLRSTGSDAHEATSGLSALAAVCPCEHAAQFRKGVSQKADVVIYDLEDAV